MQPLTLFEDLPVPVEDCTVDHAFVKTLTDWGPPYGERLTWTCTRCGIVRGRA